MDKLPIDVVEYIALSSIPVYHLLINSVPRLVSKQGLHKRAVDKFTIKEVDKYDDTQYWTLNGKRHREDGPACIFSDGSKIWVFNGEFHRKGGPACIWSDGDKEYWIHGKHIKIN